MKICLSKCECVSRKQIVQQILADRGSQHADISIEHFDEGFLEECRLSSFAFLVHDSAI